MLSDEKKLDYALPKSHKEQLELLIKKMKGELREFESESKKNFSAWHWYGFWILASSIVSALLAGLGLIFTDSLCLRIAIFILPLVVTGLTAWVNFNKFREKEVIWELGRIRLQQLIGHAEKHYVDASDNESKMADAYISVLDTFTKFSETQHAQESATRSDALIAELGKKVEVKADPNK